MAELNIIGQSLLSTFILYNCTFWRICPIHWFQTKERNVTCFFCRLRLCSKILDNCSFFSVTVFSLFFPLSLRLETSLNCHSQNPPEFVPFFLTVIR